LNQLINRQSDVIGSARAKQLTRKVIDIAGGETIKKQCEKFLKQLSKYPDLLAFGKQLISFPLPYQKTKEPFPRFVLTFYVSFRVSL
jgi:hypothetical protein